MGLCDGKIFKAHKAVLCSRSSVFRAMLGNMSEARKGEVTLTDLDSGTFAAVLTYVYTGELEEMQDYDNMIYAAKKYDLPGLKTLLFLKTQLTVNNLEKLVNDVKEMRNLTQRL